MLMLVFVACSKGQEVNSEESNKHNNIEQTENFYNYISLLKVPDSLDFCGERVPLEIEEVRERAEREFYLLLQQPGQIILYLKRSGRYFPMFEKIIEENNMPDDIKYLAVAESALYMARSPKNAVGLWQFIPSTAKSMGLIVNKYADERRHPEKSTRAAMKYLKSGFDTHGSWFLAAAGYNMGHHNVTKHLSYQSADDVFDLFMNEETSRYLLRIVIIKELMKNAIMYGFKLDSSELYKPDKIKIVKAQKVNNLAEWAREQGTTYKYIRLLNPWILKRKLPTLRKGQYYEVSIPEL